MFINSKALHITIAFLFGAAVLARPCCLCEDCIVSATNEPNTIDVDFNKTCLDVAIGAVALDASQCHEVQQKYSDTCCPLKARTLQVQQRMQPKPEAASNYAKGNHPVCHLCRRDGSYPQHDHVGVVSLLFSGVKKCEEIYWMGRQGAITTQHCGPIGAFLEKPCGCYVNSRSATQWTTGSSTKGNEDLSTMDTVPEPLQALSPVTDDRKSKQHLEPKSTHHSFIVSQTVDLPAPTTKPARRGSKSHGAKVDYNQTSAQHDSNAKGAKATTAPHKLSAKSSKTTAAQRNLGAKSAKAPAAPHNLSATGAQATAAPHNLSAKSAKATAAPHNLSAKSAKATAAPHNLSAKSAKATAAPHNLSAKSAKATAAPHNMSAKSAKATAAPHNLSAKSAKATTAPNNLSAKVTAGTHNLSAKSAKATAAPHNLSAKGAKATAAPHNLSAKGVKAKSTKTPKFAKGHGLLRA